MTPRKAGLLLALLAVVAGAAPLPSICQDTDPLVVLGHEILPSEQVCIPPDVPSAHALASPA